MSPPPFGRPMSRAYLRVDPAMYERKLDQGYAVPQIGAFLGCLCLADSQSHRGRFRNLSVLRALLGPAARHVPFLVERHDLVVDDRGRVYVDGWDEWQEGDWQVKERLARVRNKHRAGATAASVSDDTHLAGGGAGRSNGRAARPDNVYEAFRQLTGKEPDAKERKWLEDLCHDMHRGHVLDAMHADPDPTKRGFLGRISRQLRGGIADTPTSGVRSPADLLADPTTPAVVKRAAQKALSAPNGS